MNTPPKILSVRRDTTQRIVTVITDREVGKPEMVHLMARLANDGWVEDTDDNEWTLRICQYRDTRTKVINRPKSFDALLLLAGVVVGTGLTSLVWFLCSISR